MEKRLIAGILAMASGAFGMDRVRPDRDAAHVPVARPDSALHRIPTTDLDLTLGLDEDPAPAAAVPPSRTNWYYWAAAGAAVAAGGAGLYWYEDRANPSGSAKRNEQVFTDEQ